MCSGPSRRLHSRVVGTHKRSQDAVGGGLSELLPAVLPRLHGGFPAAGKSNLLACALRRWGRATSGEVGAGLSGWWRRTIRAGTLQEAKPWQDPVSNGSGPCGFGSLCGRIAERMRERCWRCRPCATGWLPGHGRVGGLLGWGLPGPLGHSGYTRRGTFVEGSGTEGGRNRACPRVLAGETNGNLRCPAGLIEFKLCLRGPSWAAQQGTCLGKSQLTGWQVLRTLPPWSKGRKTRNRLPAPLGPSRGGAGGGGLLSFVAVRTGIGEVFGSEAHVAQSVERVLGKDEVTSSILVMGSSFRRNQRQRLESTEQAQWLKSNFSEPSRT